MSAGIEEIQVRAQDGHRFSLSVTLPRDPVATLLWLPALGVAARHYQPFAQSLARHGIATFMHEWRGHGSSSLRALRAAGARAVLLKGGHLDEGTRVIDRLLDGPDGTEFIHERLTVEGHGTGCTLASAIAAHLCRGLTVRDACEAATAYIARALALGYRPGKGPVVVLDHFGAARVQ